MRLTTASVVSLSTIFGPLLRLATSIPTVVGEPDDSLLSVYDSMTIDTDATDFTIHDPSRIITVGNKHLIDKGKWKPGQCLFRTKPIWVTEEAPNNNGAFWAPELDLKDDGTLTLLYSVSEMGEGENGENTCVGVARSTTGLVGFPDNLNWEDVGEPLTCINWPGGDAEERSAIDPSTYWGFGENENKLFLVTGGGRIISTELDPGSYLQKDGEWFDEDDNFWTELSTGPNQEDDNWVEAAYIHPKPDNGYYYLFVNWGACCSGVDSTYEIRVGRSRNPMGPYMDKNGKGMMQGGGKLVANTKDFVIGPGHTGIYTKNGKEFLTFHYYDERREGNSWIAERRLRWTLNGWPRLGGRVLRAFPADML